MMFTKKNMNKAEKRRAHKIVVLSMLLVEELDEANADATLARDIVNTCNSLTSKLEKVVDDIYKIKGVAKSTYLTDLNHKLDTCIRKNFNEVID